MKVLVFGKTGQVATELRRLAGADLEVVSLGREEADLSEPGRCSEIVSQTDADVVINAAAYTAVDKAEEEEALASKINGESPGAMAWAAAARDLPFLHISTDYVFDGHGTTPWTELDPVGPVSAYGRSKLSGEVAIQAAGSKYAILRTAWVFAPYGTNFVNTMLRVGAARDKLTVIADQHGGPTPAESIASALIRIASSFQVDQGVSGIFHYCGSPATTWHEFACEIFARSSLENPPEVIPIATSEWPTAAERPANSVLDCTKIRETYGIEQPDWRRAINQICTKSVQLTGT